MPCLSKVPNYKLNLITYLNPEFQISWTNGSRGIGKGCGSTFEGCHALLDSKSILSFGFVGPMAVLELVENADNNLNGKH